MNSRLMQNNEREEKGKGDKKKGEDITKINHK